MVTRGSLIAALICCVVLAVLCRFLCMWVVLLRGISYMLGPFGTFSFGRDPLLQNEVMFLVSMEVSYERCGIGKEMMVSGL